jgi:hypothetical protein
LTLTSNSFSTAFLDLRLGRIARDLEHDLVVLGRVVAFSVITGER